MPCHSCVLCYGTHLLASTLHSLFNFCTPQELNRLEDDANVFKLIGPALIRQDLVEAKSNVSKRIEYIKNEADRSDSQLKNLESKNKEKEGEVRRGRCRRGGAGCSWAEDGKGGRTCP
jgi:hypothetical protein